MKRDVAEAVDLGWQLLQQIERLEKELEACEEIIRAAALAGQQIPLEDAERDGRQYLAIGNLVTVPVVLTADMIQASFADRSPTYERLSAIAGPNLDSLYQPVVTWKMVAKGGKEFRRMAADILGDRAAEFVSAATLRDKHGVPKSAVKVEWKRAHVEAEKPAAAAEEVAA